jgi:hypothetical protein
VNLETVGALSSLLIMIDNFHGICFIPLKCDETGLLSLKIIYVTDYPILPRLSVHDSVCELFFETAYRLQQKKE